MKPIPTRLCKIKTDSIDVHMITTMLGLWELEFKSITGSAWVDPGGGSRGSGMFLLLLTC